MVTMTEPSGSRSTVESMDDGRLKITLDLVDGKPVDVTALAGMRNVPPMWNARVKIAQVEGLSLQVTPFGYTTTYALSIGSDVIVTQSNCSIGELPLALRLQGEPGHYVLYVEPTLAPAGC